MYVSNPMPAILVSAVAVTLLFDVLALPLGYAGRRGYTSSFKIAQRYVSNLLGFVLLCICVPGTVLTIIVCFLRSWSDNQTVFGVLCVFVAGAVLGFFMSADTVEMPKPEA